MIVRHVTLEDAQALAELDALCFLDNAWSLDQVRGSLALTTTKGWALVEDNRLIGYLLAQHIGSEAEILTIGVHPNHQRRGLALTLLQTLLAEPGMRAVFLEVAVDNDPALRLYEKCGFEAMGRRVGYYVRRTGQVDALTFRYLCKG